MSLSKATVNCGFCQIGKGIYNCPRCGKKYCSSFCYKCKEHQVCSESFYEQWVKQTLQEQYIDQHNKAGMLQILKKFEEHEASIDEESSLEERFSGLDIDSADEKTLLEMLNKEEKSKFKALIKNKHGLEKILPVKEPWWLFTKLNLVSEFNDIESASSHNIAVRPPFPLNIKPVSELTSIKPSVCIKFKLVNILLGYSFLYRFYNCDIHDFLEEVVDYFFILNPVLKEGKNYMTLEEAIQDSFRLILSHFQIPALLMKNITSDVNKILNGPSNAKPSTFVICALNDMKIALQLLKSNSSIVSSDKGLKKHLQMALKQIDYLIGWSLEYEESFKEIASNLTLIMLQDLLPNMGADKVEIKQKAKSLIEEIN